MVKQINPIVILLVMLITVSASPDLNQTNITLEFDPSAFKLEIIDKLINDITYENKTILGWKYRTGSTRDTTLFWQRGYNVGTAGIADVLLDQISMVPEISELVNQIIDQLVIDSKKEDMGISWGRYANFTSESWFGLRYGTMGILKFLSNAYVELNRTDLGKTFDDAITWMNSQKLVSGEWEISPDNYITTGLEYGMAGIGMGFLDLYNTLLNNTFLKSASEIASWLQRVGRWEDEKFFISWTTEGQETEFEDYAYTSLGVGETGVLSFFLDMYKITLNQTYMDLAVGIGNSLLSLEINGKWKKNTVSYISNHYGSNDYFTGFLTGSSGIAHTLFRLYDFTLNEELLAAAARAENYVNSLVEEEGSVLADEKLDRRYTGYSMGSIGVIKYFLTLYNRYGGLGYINSIHRMFNHLHELWDEYGLIPIDESALEYGFSYNIDDGIAGLILILDEYQNLNVTLVDDNYNSILSEEVKTPTLAFQLIIVVLLMKSFLRKSIYYLANEVLI